MIRVNVMLSAQELICTIQPWFFVGKRETLEVLAGAIHPLAKALKSELDIGLWSG